MEVPAPCSSSGAQESPQDTEHKARGTDTLDSANESHLLSSAANPSVKGRPSKRITRGPFVKLADCAHYHYENVNYGPIQLTLSDSRTEEAGCTEGDVLYIVQVTCQGRSWSVLRSYEDFRVLDSNLHRCIFDRRFSQLLELPPRTELPTQGQLLAPLLSRYVKGLTGIVDSNINCGPILNWMEIDNHGNRLLVNEEASINVPAIAAAHVIKRYTAQAPDELSFEVGDIVSVIDMPPREDTSWWRGKHSFQVGFFPSECVQLITDSKSPSPTGEGDVKLTITPPHGSNSPRPVCRRHGKLAGLLRSFMASRPSKQRLRQRGILRERVFGTDLGEHLLNSGEEVPRVLLCCTQFIEKYGVVDGIYRLSGVSSNIQKLRHEFDSERTPDLSRDTFLQDVHCVSSLCKLYFRELPNPLLTYRLYQPFTEAMSAVTEEDKLIRVHDLIQQLPPPHYRTLEYLMKHLSQLSSHSDRTGMHARNLAIIWAPNLLRSRDMESVGLPGADAFREVRVQSVLVEFLLCHVETLFSDTFTSIGRCGPIRPRSLLGVCPSGRLVSLQEAQARSQSQREAAEKLGTEKSSPTKAERGLENSEERKAGRGRKKSGGGTSWRTFFAIGKNSSHKKSRLGGMENRVVHQRVSDTVTLRSAKSEESLCSHTSGTGLQRSSRLRRPRSTSEGLTTRLPHFRSVESLGPSSPPHVPSPPASARPQSAWIEEDLDLSPPLPDADGLGFDPLSFRLSFSDHEEVKSPVIVRAEITSPAVAKALPRGVSLSPTAGCSPSPTHSPPERLVVDGQSQGPRGLSPPPQMLSLLLQSCQQHLSDNSVREVKGKLTGAPGQEEPHNNVSPQQSTQPPPMSLLRQIPPPPPPKDPARLMALKLAESAQRALQASTSTGTIPAKTSQRPVPINPPSSAFRRSLSMECSETTVPREGILFSDLRPPELNTNEKSIGQHRPLKLPAHNTLATSSSPADVRKPTPTGIPPTHAPRLHTRSGSLPVPPNLCPPRVRPPPYRFPEDGPRLPHQCSAPPWTEPEGLYYEIVGDPPHMAPLNTSYGLIQPPWPHGSSSQPHPGFGNWYGGSHGTNPEVVAYSRWDRGLHPQLRPYMVGAGVHYQYVRTPESGSHVLPLGKREEPIYVNLPLKVERREQHDGTNDVAALKPELPQKQHPTNPSNMGYHESARGVTHTQWQVRHPHLLRREASLSYFRPPSSHKAMWGTQPKFPEGRENPIFAYEASTGAGQRMGHVHPHCLLSEEGMLYGNLEQRGVQHRSATPVGPPGFLRAPWTVHSEGQTRSYC
ncbi:rho GTPase-activating protein 33 isoform X1 [Xenopus laevis]|uniref:Rho GTPase-activating protein 33 n=1 Tax=Xenopus laevis TaxID=8355 RepID=A0A8J1L8A2_XENLA|nr:rho GTPase-activating protein 33 isoform X1 [Xenopus laevis]XP_041425768.1 rho GTPase-activating protein 33 isoform X1 [Xenopus laevis]